MAELIDAIRTVVEAADSWCDYLDENDRKDEVPPIEAAMTLLRQTVKDADRSGPCWRCGENVDGFIEVGYMDIASRTDCGESTDGAPHEIDEP